MYISVAEPDLQIVGGGAEIRGAPPLDTPLLLFLQFLSYDKCTFILSLKVHRILS